MGAPSWYNPLHKKALLIQPGSSNSGHVVIPAVCTSTSPSALNSDGDSDSDRSLLRLDSTGGLSFLRLDSTSRLNALGFLKTFIPYYVCRFVFYHFACHHHGPLLSLAASGKSAGRPRPLVATPRYVPLGFSISLGPLALPTLGAPHVKTTEMASSSRSLVMLHLHVIFSLSPHILTV
jgi:hypothetical protein